MSSVLVKLEQIEQMLATITTVAEAKKVRDHAATFQHYAKTAKLGLKVQNHCAYVKLVAERRAGELLRQMADHGERERRGGDRRSNSHESSLKLDDLGISWDQSSRWQRLTKVTVEQLAGLRTSCDQHDEELTFNRVAMYWRDEMRLPEAGDEFTDNWNEERERGALFDAALALVRMAARVLAPAYIDDLKCIMADRRELLVGHPDVAYVRDAFAVARERLNWGIAALECRLQDPTTPLSFDDHGHVLYGEDGEPLVRIIPRMEWEKNMAPTS